MTEPTCPECDGVVDGIGRPKARRRSQPAALAPDSSTGYCMACHLPLTKHGSTWRRS